MTKKSPGFYLWRSPNLGISKIRTWNYLHWFIDRLRILPGKVSYIPEGEELKECLTLISHGDQVAFSKLLRSYWNKVYTQALTYLKDPFVAKELTQDVMLKLWTSREKLPAIENFSNYLFILSKNEIISTLRRKKHTLNDPMDQVAPQHEQPDEQLHSKETYHQILNLIDQLPQTRKLVFKMSRLEGKSYEEIGKILGISRNGVKDHIVKALNYLRTQLSFRETEEVLILVATTACLFS